MTFVFAFILCGLLCAIFQLVFSVTHWNPQHILIGSIAIGALLMPFGVMTALEGLAGAGIIATFTDAGTAFAGTLAAALSGAGWAPYITIVCVVVAQIPLGIIAGALYTKLHPEEFERE